MISKDILEEYYLNQKRSVKEISLLLNYSTNKIIYWMDKYQIKRRTISDAIYCKHNPHGDPFSIKPIKTINEARLMGIGMGLYWGEGNKANRHSVRLGNTDPELISIFIRFLVELFGVNKNNLRFSLQIFSDIDQDVALAFWVDKLAVKASQFYKITVTISGSVGTYRHKNTNGVVTVYFHNKKLRDILVGMLPR